MYVNNPRGAGNYTFWPDGSLKSDDNEQISNIVYDSYLKQPTEIQLVDGRKINHFYDGAGALLKTVYSNGEYWQYSNGMIYKNGQPYQINTPEGRYTYQNNTWTLEFDHKDHLGNTRVSFKANGTQLEKTAETAFDPWGVVLNGVGQSNAFQNRFEMQGKESEKTFGLNRINLGARTVNPTTGVFDRIDVLAEISRRFSPYVYVNNNPLVFIDPDGMASRYNWDNGKYENEKGQEVGWGAVQQEYGIGQNAQESGDPPSKKKGESKKVENHLPTLSTVNPTTKEDPIVQGGLGLAAALALDDATGIGVLDDPLIPVVLAGTATYAAVQSGLIQKMADEIDRILQKANGPQGSVYELRVRKSGTYVDVRGNLVTLNAGDIWKYGETTKNEQRYGRDELNKMVPGGVVRTDFYFGNQVQIKVLEKYLIYGYYFNTGSLPPGNRIFR